MYRVSGNLDGIRRTALEQLDSLFDIPSDSTKYIDEFVLTTICEISYHYNREISVYIARNGKLLSIDLGDNDSVGLKNISVRRDSNRLCGVRCIHTHPNASFTLSAMDTSALISLKLDAMSAVSVLNGKADKICTAVIALNKDDNYEIVNISLCSEIPHEKLLEAIMHAEDDFDKGFDSLDNGLERVLLLGIDNEASLDELAALAETANVLVVEKLLQKREAPDSASYIGDGKAKELARIIQTRNIETVICDDEISGSMQKRLEELLNCKVIDRTALILDIFAKHSRSAESKLQVEAAQLKYRSQRLIGLGTELSRLGGGIGTRGPGESKLEVDRRRIAQRLSFLEKEIKSIAEQRKLRRKEREKNNIPVVALVGYTNAGKSSLLNALTYSDAYVENKLFATLDALTRKYQLSDGQDILLVDTVGFIKKLPHFLVKTFSSTLEEAALADLTIIVLDGSSSEMMEHYATVQDTLESINACNSPSIVVINKCDLIEKKDFEKGIYISAKTGEGLEKLDNAIIEALRERYITAKYFVPYSNMHLLAYMHDNGKVLNEEYTDNGVIVEAKLPNNVSKRLSIAENIKAPTGDICI